MILDKIIQDILEDSEISNIVGSRVKVDFAAEELAKDTIIVPRINITSYTDGIYREGPASTERAEIKLYTETLTEAYDLLKLLDSKYNRRLNYKIQDVYIQESYKMGGSDRPEFNEALESWETVLFYNIIFKEGGF